MVVAFTEIRNRRKNRFGKICEGIARGENDVRKVKERGFQEGGRGQHC